MTSPRTPRQWNAGSEEPEGDVQLFHERHGFVERRRGGWLFVRMPDGTPYPEELHGQPGWAWESNQHWPLSEVLPETPEHPREDEERGDIWQKRRARLVGEDAPVAGCGCCDFLSKPADGKCVYCSHPARTHRHYVPVPASQSVPAVPVSSTGGKETGEGDEGVQATSEAWTLHTAITAGIKRGLADFGAELTGCTAAALTGHVISQLREAGLHPSPLSDSETEWGWDPDSEFPGDVIVAVDEAAARERAGAARGRLLMQRRAPGPWIEVTS